MPYKYMNVQCDHPGSFCLLNKAKSRLVLLKALPPVCMKYTARDESRVANIARGEVECYICHKTFIKSCIFYTNKAAVF